MEINDTFRNEGLESLPVPPPPSLALITGCSPRFSSQSSSHLPFIADFLPLLSIFNTILLIAVSSVSSLLVSFSYLLF